MIKKQIDKSIILSMPRSGTNFVSSVLRPNFNISTEPLRKSRYTDNFDVKSHFYELIKLPRFCFKYFLEFEDTLSREELLVIFKNYTITSIFLIRRNILESFISYKISTYLKFYDIYEFDSEEEKKEKYRLINEANIDVEDSMIEQYYESYKNFINFYNYFRQNHKIDHLLFYEDIDFTFPSLSKKMLNRDKLNNLKKKHNLEERFCYVSRKFTDISQGIMLKDDIY